MKRPRRLITPAAAALLGALLATGCVTTFSAPAAREVSRERLLDLSEAGTADHLRYMGSDFSYHYVYDARPGQGRSYKIRVSELKLRDTFRVGEDSYVLLPWVVEGKPFGSKTTEAVTNAPPAEGGR
jgi:hypothetical protein